MKVRELGLKLKFKIVSKSRFLTVWRLAKYVDIGEFGGSDLHVESKGLVELE